MSTPNTLIQMPNLVLGHIFEYLDFPSILVLRKVCHDLRNFIDDTKPASRLAHIHVVVKLECILFQVGFKCSSMNATREKTYYINYMKNGEGCLAECNKGEKIRRTTMDNEDFVIVFFKDLDIVLRHQKTVLEVFKIYSSFLNSTIRESVLENANNSLKFLNHSLRVKSLFMEVNNLNETLSILPYIDPKSLESISINDISRINNVWNLDDIGQLEQWKQADELTISGFRLPYLSQNAKHFSKITFWFREFSLEELILLKEVFFYSSTLRKMKIVLNRINAAIIRQKLVETFGQPFRDTNQDNCWFLGIPDTNQFLRIRQRDCQIKFDRIEQSDVPQNAIILN